MTVVSLFGKPIFITQKFELSPVMEKFIKSIKYKAYPMPGGNYDSEDTHVLDSEELKPLKEFLLKMSNHFFHHICQVVDDTELYITQSWLVKNIPGSYHVQHYHANSIVSGVYYIEGEEKTGIEYVNQTSNSLFGSTFGFKYKGYNDVNSVGSIIPNYKNHALISPSNIEHNVVSNNTNNDRISLAFNTFVKGKINDDISLQGLYL